MVGESLHQFDESGPLYKRDSTALFPLLEHDVVGRVFFCKSVYSRIGEPERTNTIRQVDAPLELWSEFER